MKINIQIMIFGMLGSMTSQLCSMEQIKTNIKNILKTDITIDVTQKKMCLIITKGLNSKQLYSHTITLYDTQKEQLATCSFYPIKNYIYMSDFGVVKKYRHKGLGENFFYLSMYTIKQTYPDKPHVMWIAVADDNHDQPLLNKFYLRVGAHKEDYEENDYDFYINLKEAGYHDEN